MKGALSFVSTVLLILVILTPVYGETAVIELVPDNEPGPFDTGRFLETDFNNESTIFQNPIFRKTNVERVWVPHRWMPSDWNRDNSILQQTVVVFIMADWLQTRYIARNPGEYQEINPILGNHPSLGDVDRYFACCLIGNTLIAYLLPKKLRLRWQAISLRIQLETVNHNYNMGIKLSL